MFADFSVALSVTHNFEKITWCQRWLLSSMHFSKKTNESKITRTVVFITKIKVLNDWAIKERFFAAFFFIISARDKNVAKYDAETMSFYSMMVLYFISKCFSLLALLWSILVAILSYFRNTSFIYFLFPFSIFHNMYSRVSIFQKL